MQTETVVKCLQPGGDSLLHIDICCTSLDSHVLLKALKGRIAIDTRSGTIKRMSHNIAGLQS
jgi:hypothetical protein